MRVFPDTNVLASALGTRGLCADVLRLVLAEHESVTGEIVIEELRGVLRKKFGLPTRAVAEVETLLRATMSSQGRACCLAYRFATAMIWEW